MRLLPLVLLSLTVTILTAASVLAEENKPFLTPWPEEVPFPTRAELTFPEGCEHFIVHDSEADPVYKFLHETAVGFCGDELVVGWYHNPEKELSGKTFQRARRSRDGGKSWSDPEIVMDRDNDKGLMYVGLQFVEKDGVFYAVSNQESGAEKPVDALLLDYDKTAKRWNEIGPIAPRFLSMQQPMKMDDGDWVVAGSYNPTPGEVNGIMPCVYVSRGDDFTQPWRRYLIDTEFVNIFAETAVIPDGANLMAVTRREDTPFPNFYVSGDFGRTWERIVNETFPTSSTKYAGGRLSDGTRYLIYNHPDFERDENGRVKPETMNRDRSMLAIALAKPGEKTFTRIYKISDPSTPTRQVLSHYPCAVERDGKLYISYTGKHRLRNAGLTVVPMDSLR